MIERPSFYCLRHCLLIQEVALLGAHLWLALVYPRESSSRARVAIS